MRSFTELRVWKAAHVLTLDIYRVTRRFPIDERFGLSAQLRRSAASVPANIAEGSMAVHGPDFARILNVAEKEAAEAAYHLLLARDLGYLPEADWMQIDGRLEAVRKMLNVLRRKVSAAASQEPTASSQQPMGSRPCPVPTANSQ